jgi:hypothetical protein
LSSQTLVVALKTMVSYKNLRVCGQDLGPLAPPELAGTVELMGMELELAGMELELGRTVVELDSQIPNADWHPRSR